MRQFDRSCLKVAAQGDLRMFRCFGSLGEPKMPKYVSPACLSLVEARTPATKEEDAVPVPISQL